MSEKPKRLDLEQIKALIEFEKNEVAERRIANGEKIARRILHEIAAMNCKVWNGVVYVRFHIWQRGIADYSPLTVKDVLKANGLMLSREHVFNSDVLDDSGWLFLPGRTFTARVELWHADPPDKTAEITRIMAGIAESNEAITKAIVEQYGKGE